MAEQVDSIKGLDAVQYPIAEMFDSPQGEGFYAGTYMRFIRLAGCNVGRYTKSETETEHLGTLRILNPRHSICTTVFGQRFQCDTDYHRAKQATVEELLDTNARHICITGGEPFMHDLVPLIIRASDKYMMVHIETSGTLPIPKAVGSDAWITCSPKEGLLLENRMHIDEWKFVIDPALIVWEDFIESVKKLLGPSVFDKGLVYIQPVNDVNEVDKSNLRSLLELQKLEPRFRISPQIHKFFGVR